MKIELDEYRDIRVIISGLYQFNELEQFSQAALASTDNELLFYNDNAPDEKDAIKNIYHIKKRIKLDNVLIILDDKIKKNRYLSNMGRLDFLVDSDSADGEQEEVMFYYFLSDRKAVDSFLDDVKTFGIKVKKRKVDLSYSKI